MGWILNPKPQTLNPLALECQILKRLTLEAEGRPTLNTRVNASGDKVTS